MGNRDPEGLSDLSVVTWGGLRDGEDDSPPNPTALPIVLPVWSNDSTE